MPIRRRVVAILALLVAPLVATCRGDLTTVPDIVVQLAKVGIWPDTISLAGIATLAVQANRIDSVRVAGLELTWESSDPTVAAVTTQLAPASERLTAALKATLTALAPGSATISVRLGRPGFATSELKLPIVVARRGLPTILTASDTASVVVAISGAEQAVTNGATVEWSSSNPTIMQVARSVTDPFRATMTGIASGTAQAIATISSQRLARTVFQVPIAVAPMQVTEAPEWPTSFTVTDSTTFAVEVRDASGQRILTGMPVQWRSTNALAMSVDATGKVKALSAGGGEIVATVGNPSFQTTEHRVVVSIGAIQINETSPWPKTLTVSDSTSLAITIRDATGQRAMTGVPVQWRSSNSLALTVDGSGKIKAIANGGADIIATAGDVPFQTAEHRVSVSVGGFEIAETSPWPTTLTVTDTTQLGATVRDASHATKAGARVRWSSTNVVAFTVDSTGRVIALSPGGGEVVASVGDPPFQTTEHRVTVTVRPLTVSETSPWPKTLTVTDTARLAAIVRDVANKTKAAVVRWSSTNVVAFAVDATGRVIALAPGGGEVVATVGDPPFQTAEHRVAVAVSPLRVVATGLWPVSVNATNDTLIAARVLDAAGNPKPGIPIHWRSTNEAAFSVASSGRVSGLTRGAGEIVASAGDPPFQAAELHASFTVLQRWKAITAGTEHTCAIAADRTGFCWGRNRFGELGTGAGTFGATAQPRQIATLYKFDDIAAGGDSVAPPNVPDVREPEAHTCGRSGNSVLCWGSTVSGQVGDGTGPCTIPFRILYSAHCQRSVPSVVVDNGSAGGRQGFLTQVVKVGYRMSCGLIEPGFGGDYFVNCWGMMDSSTSGYGSIPLAVAGNGFFHMPGAFTDWAIGAAHVCSSGSHGQISCTGANDYGQSGVIGDPVIHDGAGQEVFFPSRLFITDSITTLSAAAGAKHSCALQSATVLHCWGSNERGQLGAVATGHCNGSVPANCSRVALTVPLPVPMKAVVAGRNHTCILANTGEAYCWGANDAGQLGRGTIGGQSQSPMPVSGGLKFAWITGGEAHTCGVTLDGSAYCWGRNDNGQLGNGSQASSGGPVRVNEPPP